MWEKYERAGSARQHYDKHGVSIEQMARGGGGAKYVGQGQSAALSVPCGVLAGVSHNNVGQPGPTGFEGAERVVQKRPSENIPELLWGGDACSLPGARCGQNDCAVLKGQGRRERR